jgi:hypothetical protein
MRSDQRSQYLEPPERALGAVGAVNVSTRPLRRVDVDSAELCHVAGGGRADAEGCFEVNDEREIL